MLYEMVSNSPLGLTDVEKATSGAVDTEDQIDRCAGEPLSNMEDLFCAFFHCYTGIIPGLFLHYIDDYIGTASCSHEEFEQFINFTNIFHPNVKFTCTISDTSLSFLDLSVSIS
eukprot:g30470.t1